jgi:hypothetical protein
MEHLDAEQSVVRSEAARHKGRIEAIKAKQAKLLELAYEDLVSKDVLRDEQARLRAEERAVDSLVRQAHVGSEGLSEALDDALERHREPQRAYFEADRLYRRAMNRLIFERIEVGPEMTRSRQSSCRRSSRVSENGCRNSSARIGQRGEAGPGLLLGRDLTSWWLRPPIAVKVGSRVLSKESGFASSRASCRCTVPCALERWGVLTAPGAPRE